MSIMLQNRNNCGGVPNKIGASLFLLVFALSGMFFMGIMTYSFYQGAAAGSWVETPCRITAGEIVYPQRSGMPPQDRQRSNEPGGAAHRRIRAVGRMG